VLIGPPYAKPGPFGEVAAELGAEARGVSASYAVLRSLNVLVGIAADRAEELANELR
jgi:hypothetical protein